jgi:serine/threonine protein kinase
MPVLPLNTIVGKYRIDDLAGVGGMGEVYRAVHIQNGTVVAIKSLNNDAESGTALARFKNEAIIQFNLRHPNVAALYEYVDYPGHPCVVMGFVEGPTLQDLVRERGLPLAKALDILAGVCDAFAYMHLKGVMHRDIKSENIRIAADGTPKLLDFGIAVAKSTPVFTRAGQVIGTLQSLAPEHVRGLRGDARSDVWALGVLLYEMLTGTLPFDGTDVGKVAKSILEGRYAPASELKPGIPRTRGTVDLRLPVGQAGRAFCLGRHFAARGTAGPAGSSASVRNGMDWVAGNAGLACRPTCGRGDPLSGAPFDRFIDALGKPAAGGPAFYDPAPVRRYRARAGRPCRY